MDRKAVFVRTSIGEDESSGKTANLYSAIKRVLVMVDGNSTFGEISKRVAPSLRDSLDEMFRELEKGGFIQEKQQKPKAGSIPKMANPPKMSVPLKMAAPPKASAPPKVSEPPRVPEPPKVSQQPRVPEPPRMEAAQQPAPPSKKPAEEAGGDLDFMNEFFSSTPAQLAAEAEDGAKLKAQQEAEAILRKAEQEAARIREEADRAAAEIAAREEQARRARQEAEAARARAEQEAEQARARLEAARLKAEQEARAHLEEADRMQKQAEAERIKAAALAQAAAKAREEAEKLAQLQADELQATQAAPAEMKLDPFVMDSPASATPPPSVEEPIDAQQEKTVATPEVKLDPFFVFEPFNIQTPSQSSAAPPKKPIAAEPEIKLDAFTFDAPKAAPPPPAAQPPQRTASPAKTSPAQTGQADEARQPARQAAPPVSKPVESQPSQEQIKRVEQERIAAEARAKKLAEEQAKAWAEAEKREAEAAMASSKLTFQKPAPPVTQASAAVPRATPARVSRKPFPWGMLSVFLLVLLVGALFIVPYVLPMRDYMPKVEQMLSARLQQPVHIGQMAARILPTPRLELGEIYIGDVKQFQTQQAYIYFSIAGLLGETKPIDSIELQGVKVTGAGLQPASAWLQQLAADDQYPVRRIAISQGVLDADAIQVTGIDGELNFNAAGKFTQANLRANAGKIELGIQAAPGGRQQIALTMYDSALPLLPSWSFDQLTAKGELSDNGLKITEFDGRLLGGMLTGEANIEWRSGWRVQGMLAATTITLQNIAQGLSGDMDGSARFLMQSANLSTLADAPTMGGTFVVRKGVVNGIDIVETARSRSKQSVPGGRTHFEELTGVLAVTKDGLVIRQLKMDAGELQVSGTLNIAAQQVSGKISADLTKWAGMGKVTMQVVGTTDNPALQAAH